MSVNAVCTVKFKRVLGRTVGSLLALYLLFAEDITAWSSVSVYISSDAIFGSNDLGFCADPAVRTVAMANAL